MNALVALSDSVPSGDDHDYCEITHPLTASDDSSSVSVNSVGVEEISVKSLSMAMGIRRPGFSLLSLSSGGAAHRMCVLPDQLGMYIQGYLPVFLLTSLVVLVHASRRGSSGRYAATTGLPYSRSEFTFDHDRRRSSITRVDLVPHWVQRRAQSLERTALGRFVVDLATVAWFPLLTFSVLAFVISW